MIVRCWALHIENGALYYEQFECWICVCYLLPSVVHLDDCTLLSIEHWAMCFEHFEWRICICHLLPLGMCSIQAAPMQCNVTLTVKSHEEGLKWQCQSIWSTQMQMWGSSFCQISVQPPPSYPSLIPLPPSYSSILPFPPIPFLALHILQFLRPLQIADSTNHIMKWKLKISLWGVVYLPSQVKWNIEKLKMLGKRAG